MTEYPPPYGQPGNQNPPPQQPPYAPPQGQPGYAPPQGPPGQGQPYGPTPGSQQDAPPYAPAPYQQTDTEMKAAGQRAMIFGALWLLGGILLTVITYSAASGGGVYVVAWGPAIYGIIQVVRGIWLLKKADG